MDVGSGVELEKMNRNDRGEFVVHKLCSPFKLFEQPSSPQHSVEVIQPASSATISPIDHHFPIRAFYWQSSSYIVSCLPPLDVDADEFGAVNVGPDSHSFLFM